MNSLLSSCEKVLRGNARGRHTVPSPRLYPHQWAWDSAFAAIGWAYLDPMRSIAELEVLLEGAWPDGRVPHIFFHDKSGAYFPGPDFWETDRSTSISQPPVWASCALRILEITGEVDGIRPLLPAIERSHRWFGAARDPKGWGCIAIAHPWESGMDNSPAWNDALSRVDVSRVPPYQRRDTEVVSDRRERPSDAEYDRYAVLVKGIAKDGFGLGDFAVYDPFMTAVLARAEADLARLSERCGVSGREAAKRSQRIATGLEAHLWDTSAGRFRAVDALTGRVSEPDVIGGYLPLWCDVSPAIREQLRRGLEERFVEPSTWAVPSTAPGDAAFISRKYWAGPVWINTNWMLADALPESPAAQHAVDLVREGGMREYFEPHTGEGLGADEFAWTAALVLDLIERGAAR